MARYSCWMALAVAVGLGVEARAESPAPAVPGKYRSLSLAEAVNHALRQAGHRIEAKGEGLVLHPGGEASGWEVERRVNQALLNVEVAYWNLYAAYWSLYTREQGLRQAKLAYDTVQARQEAGRAAQADVYQARGQYHLFRAQRLQALDQVLDCEKQLRAVTGIFDDQRLMPSDTPTRTRKTPEWKAALEQALAQRPELRMVRLDESIQEAILGLARNAEKLLGVPLPKEQIRKMQVELARAIEVRKDQEAKANSYLANYYRRLSLNYEQLQANRAQREAFAEQLRARDELFLAGRDTADVLCESQRFWADALANEHQAIAQYNNALAGFEYARGAILRRHNLTLAGVPGSQPQAEDEYPSLPAVMTAVER